MIDIGVPGCLYMPHITHISARSKTSLAITSMRPTEQLLTSKWMGYIISRNNIMGPPDLVVKSLEAITTC